MRCYIIVFIQGLGMSGRGVEAEEGRVRRERSRQKRIEAACSSSAEVYPAQLGDIHTSNVPEKLEMVSKRPETSSQDSGSGIMTSTEKRKKLEAQYQILFEDGGFEVLDILAAGDSIDAADRRYIEETIPLLVDQGFVEVVQDANQIQITESGDTRYKNWAGFRDYLSSQERAEDIDSQLRDQEMPSLLNPHLDVDMTLHSFLKDREGSLESWAAQYDPSTEFENITSLLYSWDTNQLGQNLAYLESLHNSMDVPEEIRQEFEETGLRGLLTYGSLNVDGEKLYTKAMADYTGMSM